MSFTSGANGCRIGDSVAAVRAPVAVGRNMYLTVPTGQWVIRKRGGVAIPWALASRLRSRIFMPTAPAPTLCRNERRAIRYDVIAHLQRDERKGSWTLPPHA